MYNVLDMKTSLKFAVAVLAVASLVVGIRKTCNIVVVKSATYDGLVGRWEQTPDGQFVFSDDLGPYAVLDKIPKMSK